MKLPKIIVIEKEVKIQAVRCTVNQNCNIRPSSCNYTK